MATDDKKMMAAFAMHALISRTPEGNPVLTEAIAVQAWAFADMMGQEADKRETRERSRQP